MNDQRIDILMEAIRRRRAELAEAKAISESAGSKRVGAQTFTQLLQKRQAEQMNPFRGPDKRFGGGQRKEKKEKK